MVHARPKSISIARETIERHARHFPMSQQLPAPPGLYRLRSLSGTRIVPSPICRGASPLRHEITLLELSREHDNEQIARDYYNDDFDDDLYDFDNFEDMDAMELDTDDSSEEAMDVDDDNEKLFNSIQLYLRDGSGDAHWENPLCLVHSDADEDGSTSASSVHCLRCHATYSPRDNGPSACVVPHVFKPNLGPGGWCASACCGSSICVRRTTDADEIFAESRLGEPGLDVCFRGRHTTNIVAAGYKNTFNRVVCRRGSRGCEAPCLVRAQDRELFTSDL